MINDFIRIVYRHIKENSTITANRIILKHISAYFAFV